MFESTNIVLTRFWYKFTNYLPDFFGGVFILLIGILLADIIKRILLTLISFFRFERLLEKTKLITEKEVVLWKDILVELIRWTVIILFLIPTLETWGLSRATSVLNEFLFYIPNVIVAVIIGFVGIIVSNLTSDVVKNSAKTLGKTPSTSLAVFSKSTIIFFTILIMLNQLGVAQDLIRIFFTGVVVMIALAGGLAFGLGGKDMAKSVLEDVYAKLKK